MGYYTLKCNALQVYDEDCTYNKYKIHPCIEIFRIAIDMDHRKKGIGSILLSQIIMDIVNISKYVGIKHIFLFSILNAEKFYTDKNRANIKLKQIPRTVSFLVDSKSGDCRPLYISLKDVDISN